MDGNRLKRALPVSSASLDPLALQEGEWLEWAR